MNLNSKLKLKKNVFFIFVVIIILIGVVPRIPEVLSGNYIFLYDQGQYFLEAKKIVIDHNPTLIGIQVGGAGGFFQGAGWIYLLSIPFIFSGGDPLSGMILMVLIGVGVVIAATIVGWKIFSLREGILIGFLIATSPNIIAQSRFIWPPFPVSLISVFILYSIYKILQNNKNYFILLGLLIGLTSHFEIATSGVIFVSSIVFIPFLIWRKIITIKSFTYFLISFLIPLAPLAIFDLKNNFLNLRGVINMLLPQSIPSFNQVEISINHLAVVSTSFSSMFPHLEKFWLGIAFFVLMGMYLFIKDKKQVFAKKAFVLYLALNPFLLFIIFMLYKSEIWNWWILHLYVYYCFLLGIILIYLYQKYTIGKLILIMSIIYVSFVYYQYVSNAYQRDYFDYGGTAKIKGKIDAIDSIYKEANGKNFGLIVFSPPVHTYPYDYLIWWYGQRKYNYVPHKEKKGDFYLLIEPDSSKPWSYKGWLETVIKTGDVVYTKTLPSGFIVQKRINE